MSASGSPPAVERKDLPGVRIAGAGVLGMRAAGVLGDDRCPEPERTLVSLRDTDDPATRQAIPQESSRLPADAEAAVAPQHEELLQVEIVRILGRGRATRDEREADDPRAAADQEGEAPAGLLPVERQPVVAEAPIGAGLEEERLAQIVDVELEQVGQQRCV